MKTFKSISDLEQLRNNQFALSILVPDEEWLPGDVRRHLEAHLDP